VSTMLEAARILSGVAVIMVIGALAAYMNLLGRPQLQRLNGDASANIGHLQIAALLLMTAVGLSAVAAILAIAG
jgi:hypothetical protein